MKQIIFIACILLAILVSAEAKEKGITVFNTPISPAYQKLIHAKKCHCMCKKQLLHAEEIQHALDYYKRSPYYSFSSKNRSR